MPLLPLLHFQPLPLAFIIADIDYYDYCFRHYAIDAALLCFRCIYCRLFTGRILFSAFS